VGVDAVIIRGPLDWGCSIPEAARFRTAPSFNIRERGWARILPPTA
jgi:hypothetical protein